jgi:hypothetical protein
LPFYLGAAHFDTSYYPFFSLWFGSKPTMYKQTYANMRLLLDKKDETIRAIKEHIHSLYKELYKAGIIQKGNQVTRDYYSIADSEG